MTYTLEHEDEFERLERQSKTPSYDFRKELKDFILPKKGRVLDAGCGSGIVSRYLSKKCPNGQVFACDASADRIHKAKEAASSLKNISWEIQSIDQMSFKSGLFDAVICRYVLEHLTPSIQEKAVAEMARCLKPRGTLCLIDFDGLVFNIFPQTPWMAEALETLRKTLPLDLFVGRKLPYLMEKQGITPIQWRIETVQFQGDDLREEAIRTQERFNQTLPLLTQLLGSQSKANQFIREYLEVLTKRTCALFYNKFIVIGKKDCNYLSPVDR